MSFGSITVSLNIWGTDMNKNDRKHALRLNKAADVLETVSPKEFDYNLWGLKVTNAICKTTACIAGHCALDPWFKKNGFKGEWVLDQLLLPMNHGKYKHYDLLVNGTDDIEEEVENFFGEGSYLKVFVPENSCLKGKTPKTLAKSLRKYVTDKYGTM